MKLSRWYCCLSRTPLMPSWQNESYFYTLQPLLLCRRMICGREMLTGAGPLPAGRCSQELAHSPPGAICYVLWCSTISGSQTPYMNYVCWLLSAKVSDHHRMVEITLEKVKDLLCNAGIIWYGTNDPLYCCVWCSMLYLYVMHYMSWHLA